MPHPIMRSSQVTPRLRMMLREPVGSSKQEDDRPNGRLRIGSLSLTFDFID
ncbi:hypothetical protein AAFN86_06325 [Roseomonas sp. CAU 1739]